MLQNTWVPFARCSLFYKPRTLLHCLKSLLSLRYCFRQPAHQPSRMSFWMSDEYSCIELFINSHWIFIPLLTNLFSVGVLFSVSSIRLHRLCSERSVCDNSRVELPSLFDGTQALPVRRECKDNKTRQTEAGLIFWRPKYQVSLSCHYIVNKVLQITPNQFQFWVYAGIFHQIKLLKQFAALVIPSPSKTVAIAYFSERISHVNKLKYISELTFTYML